jgi:hypothetical protein
MKRGRNTPVAGAGASVPVQPPQPLAAQPTLDPARAVEALCPACALCCDGALFRDVELQAGDDAGELRRLGLPLASRGGTTRLRQPCAALEGCRCRLYEQRPGLCRQFDCALLKAVQAGRLSVERALRHIQQTRRLADRVRQLLHQLGDRDEAHSLSVRCQRLARRLERGEPARQVAEDFSRLTLVWHRLNRKLERCFHPGTNFPPAA